MRRAAREADHARILALLEILREAPAPLHRDIAPETLRKVRALPLPRSWAPFFSFAQFAWSSAAAVVLLMVGGLGFLGMLGPEALEGASRTGGALTTIAALIARGLVRLFLVAGDRASSFMGPLDIDAGAVAGGAALVCTAIVLVTVLVVSREARERRVSG